MTEKNKSEKMTNASKPVPMKLFAAWEVDRTPSNCIPRVCTLRVTRLRLAGARGEAVSLAARMHASKRTLRSNDIALPPAPAPLDVDLDLTFTLQYPHFVKRDGNRLQIMLQRRKKYKNRTILGYKTLAEGVIRMDQVLQRSMDMELELGSAASATGKAGGPPAPLARLTIAGLASTPVDHDTKNNNNLITERGYSDEEEEAEFSSVEENDEALSYNRRAYAKMAYLDGAGYEGGTGKDRDSDSEPDTRHAKRKGSRGKLSGEEKT